MFGSKLIRVLAAMALAVGLSSNAFAQEETIKIGFGGALNGDVASYGLSGLRGVEFAIEKINAQGGIRGKKVELVKEDDSCDPSMASKAASKLLSSKVKVIIGHTCSGATISALGAYGDNVILISPSATETALTTSGKYKYFFRTIARDDAQGTVQAEAAIKNGFKKVALIHDKGDYGLNLMELAKPILEKAGIEIVMFEGITPNQMDYGAVVNKIKKSQAEAVLFGGYYPEGSKLVTQMGKANMKVVFIGPDDIRDPTFIKVAGKYAEGVYSTGPIDASKNPLAIEAVEWNKTKYGDDPGMYLFPGASATFAALHALEKAGPDASLEELKAALINEEVDTPLGKIKFDQNGDATGVGFILYQVKDGVFVPVE